MESLIESSNICRLNDEFKLPFSTLSKLKTLKEKHEEYIETNKKTRSIDKNARNLNLKFNTKNNVEQLVLNSVENLIKQYHYLYKNRMPLFIIPLNEYHVAKLVCTTIKPTILSNKILIDFQEAAEFVSDFINYKKLNEFNKIPIILNSPAEVLRQRTGNCFEISTLLTSLLIGIGYDAFVVSGYASREICNIDLSYKKCPEKNLFLNEHEINNFNEYEILTTEYDNSKINNTIPTLENLMKQFQTKYEKIEQKLNNNKNQQLKNTETNSESFVIDDKNLIRNYDNQPPYDELAGLRIHSWVLCLAGKRLINDSFFIESTTGEFKSLNDKNYHGIESLWNNENYWINFQDCTNGLKDLSYDLDDENCWEKVFFQVKGNKTSKRFSRNSYDSNSIDDTGNKISTRINQIQIITNDILSSTWLPQSWLNEIYINKNDLLKQYPNEQKKIAYDKILVKKYGPYANKNGCTMQILEFKDKNMTLLAKTFFKYENRADHLNQRIVDNEKSLVTEFFNFGRKFGLYAHQYTINAKGKADSKRIMLFNSSLRIDSLIKRNKNEFEIEEFYKHRNDYLKYIKITFESTQTPAYFDLFETKNSDINLFESQINGSETKIEIYSNPDLNNRKANNKVPLLCRQKPKRSIISIIERYERNPSKEYDEDIHEIAYNLKASTITVKYHRDPALITSTYRKFKKPIKFEDMEAGYHKFEWNPALHKCYYADPFKNTNKMGDDNNHNNNDDDDDDESTFKLHRLLFELMKKELKACERAIEIDNEIKEILKQLANDDAANELKTNLFNNIFDTKQYDSNFDDDQSSINIDNNNNNNDNNLSINNENNSTLNNKLNNMFEKQLNNNNNNKKFNKNEAKKIHLNTMMMQNRYLKRINIVQKKYNNEKAQLNDKLKNYELNKYNLINDDYELNLLNDIEKHRFNVDLLHNRILNIKIESENQYKSLENTLLNEI